MARSQKQVGCTAESEHSAIADLVGGLHTSDASATNADTRRRTTAPSDGAASVTLDVAGGESARFTALDLRDRVVIMLLFDQIVREEQVARAWRLWHQMRTSEPREPLWRVLTLFPELDRDLVYAEAARVYGFAEAHISRRAALPLVRQLERRLDAADWDALVRMRVVPVATVEAHHQNRTNIVFASNDPTRPDLHRLLERCDLHGFELRFAPEQQIVDLLVEAFPHRYTSLRPHSRLVQDVRDGRAPESGMSVAASLSAEGKLEYRDAPARPGSGTVLEVFESALVAAFRRGVSDLCILGNAGNETEMYFQLDGTLKRWRVLADLDAPTFITGVKKSVIRHAAGDGADAQRCVIRRWIDETLVRFRVSVLAPAQHVPSECIVIRMLG